MVSIATPWYVGDNKEMDALHVFWTAPYRARGIDPSQIDLVPWFERFFLALSASLWRQHSGRAVLVTDSPGAKIIESWGLSGLWSDINTTKLDNAPTDIDAAVFWDLGKTLALADCELPVALLDLDLVVWSPLKPTAATHFFHWEEVEAPWYLSGEDLTVPPGYSFPDVDWSTRPANTALLYLSDWRFRDKFVQESLRFARNNKVDQAKALAAFLFSGQRLFSLLEGTDLTAPVPFVPYVFGVRAPSYWTDFHSQEGNPLNPENFRSGGTITHLWAYKHELRRDEAKLKVYCEALLEHARFMDLEVVEELISLFVASLPSCTPFLVPAGEHCIQKPGLSIAY
jgi:hypothetical protein